MQTRTLFQPLFEKCFSSVVLLGNFRDIGICGYNMARVYKMIFPPNILSVDKINRGSAKREKFRPWQQHSTTNLTIIKTKKKKTKT